MNDQALIAAAASMLPFAYAPYSNFPVGAALLSSDGRLFLGCNVESAAFRSICAERVALVRGISEGARCFSTLAVISQSDQFCTPCGICRQMLFEFAPDLRVLCARANGEAKEYTLKALLPDGFGPANLSLNLKKE